MHEMAYSTVQFVDVCRRHFTRNHFNDANSVCDRAVKKTCSMRYSISSLSRFTGCTVLVSWRRILTATQYQIVTRPTSHLRLILKREHYYNNSQTNYRILKQSVYQEVIDVLH